MLVSLLLRLVVILLATRLPVFADRLPALRGLRRVCIWEVESVLVGVCGKGKHEHHGCAPPPRSWQLSGVGAKWNSWRG